MLQNLFDGERCAVQAQLIGAVQHHTARHAVFIRFGSNDGRRGEAAEVHDVGRPRHDDGIIGGNFGGDAFDCSPPRLHGLKIRRAG